MSDLFWLSKVQVERLSPFLPKSRGKPRIVDRQVLSETISIQRNGLTWKHAPAAYSPPKTLYNRLKRWSRMGVFATIMTELAAQTHDTGILMIDASHAKVHRMASNLAVQTWGGRLIGCIKGGLNSKLYVLADEKGRPIRMFLSKGRTSD